MSEKHTVIVDLDKFTNADFDYCDRVYMATKWEIITLLTIRDAIKELQEKARKYDEMLPMNKYMEEKAKLWDKVKEIAKRAKEEGCKGCPLEDSRHHPCYNAISVVDALEGDKPWPK